LAREPRKLSAILAADVVGYSRLMGRDESGTLARLRELRPPANASALLDRPARLPHSIAYRPHPFYDPL